MIMCYIYYVSPYIFVYGNIEASNRLQSGLLCVETYTTYKGNYQAISPPLDGNNKEEVKEIRDLKFAT